MISSDPEASEARGARLDAYLSAAVLDGNKFCCTEQNVCHTSAHLRGLEVFEGQLPHVGRNDDLQLDGHPLRIAVIDQEYGHPPAHVSMVDRYGWFMARAAFAKASQPGILTCGVRRWPCGCCLDWS